MSKLGLYGAIKGAGAGLMANARDRVAQEAEARQAKIDEARDRRLATYQSELQAQRDKEALARQESSQTAAADLTREGFTHEVGMQEAALGAAADRQADTILSSERENRLNRELTVSEGEADRTSRERIAEKTTVSAAAVKAAERFEPGTTTTSVQTESGFPMEQETATLYDKDTRVTYVQQGTMYVPQGIDPSGVRPASSGAVDMLLSDPSLANAFVEKYNYLPSVFIQNLPSRRGQ